MLQSYFASLRSNRAYLDRVGPEQVTAKVKRLLGQGLFVSHLDALLLKKDAVVVSFHRVRDGADASDGLTVDRRTFERYCRFFRRHFRVVSLADLVDGLEAERCPRRELVITFDDGYLDNFENAAPVLEKLSLPATFFVITRWIGTDVVPFWDEQQGVSHPWMTWDHVRALHRRGFDIGSHTRTHPDLGTLTGAKVAEEIFGSRFELESALGAHVQSFAYPYGGWSHLTEASRSVVKAAGFRCCCSNFGGTIAAGTDPFHVRRVPISSWYTSPHQFGFDVALRRSVDFT
jgi:peptidoglycan/xylan/chitin deacetylase (PgdA/CDA1 family)